MMFQDSITHNIEILRELIAALPPESKRMAQGAAVHMERAFAQLQKDHPKSAPVALGAAFALHLIAERMVENSTEDSSKGLIELVN
jgi:hypothetical protein